MKRKKGIQVIAGLSVCLLLAGCAFGARQSEPEKCKVVTTVFPPYDFVREIAGERVDLTMLLRPGTESHAYEPSPQDMVTIQQCDIFIYNGGESDEWVRKMLGSIDRNDKTILAMTDMVEMVEEEIVSGMQGRTEDGGGYEFDEHVWTAPANAAMIAEKISEALVEKDSRWKKEYEKKTRLFQDRLYELDGEFRKAVEEGRRKTIVVGDRFPFRYFVEAYGLKYFAAFPGCVAESEPSASTVAFLIQKVREEKIPVVFSMEMSNGKMARTVAEESGAKVLTFHSCHNVTADEFGSGASYLSLMRGNLANIKEALQ